MGLEKSKYVYYGYQYFGRLVFLFLGVIVIELRLIYCIFGGFPQQVLGKEDCYDYDLIKAVCPMA